MAIKFQPDTGLLLLCDFEGKEPEDEGQMREIRRCVAAALGITPLDFAGK